jgi:ankyrin repeat protein
LRNIAESKKPFFDDPEQERIARAIYDGEPEKLKSLLQQLPPAKLNAGGELLAFGINTANASSYKPAERFECVRVLFEAGAKLDSTTTPGESPMYIAVASNGDAALMRLLLDHGADAKLEDPYYKRPLIFEAVSSYKEPLATVKVLLEYGADPNVTAVLDDDEGPISPLVSAAKWGRWGICTLLIEKGAKIGYTTQNGLSLQSLVAEADKDFSADGYSSREEFEALKKVLNQKK